MYEGQKDLDKIKNIVNLTGHNIRIYNNPEDYIDIPPHTNEDGTTVRLLMTPYPEKIGTTNFNGKEIKVVNMKYIPPKDLDKKFPQREDTIYIVSSIIAQKINRKDFWIIGETIKDPVTRALIGCKFICPNPYC